jgi:hypothetical protein
MGIAALVSFAILLMIGFFALLVIGEIIRAVYIRLNTMQQGRIYRQHTMMKHVTGRVTNGRVAF